MVTEIVQFGTDSEYFLSLRDAPDADDDELYEDQAEDGDDLSVLFADIFHESVFNTVRANVHFT